MQNKVIDTVPVRMKAGALRYFPSDNKGREQSTESSDIELKQQCSIVEALEHINRNFSALNQLVTNIALSVSSQYQHRLSGCCGGDGTGIGLNGGNGGGEEEG
jgi:hypothetical protein